MTVMLFACVHNVCGRPCNIDVSVFCVGFQYPLAELSAEDRITICIIESYLDFKVTNFRKAYMNSSKVIGYWRLYLII